MSGFEGLTLDSTGNTLYAMLQSATIQDGGDDKDTSRYARLLGYDVSSALTTAPPLIGEWVVPLPQTSKGKTLAQSEVHFVKENVFLVLARDGDGHGGDDDKSSYKCALFVTSPYYFADFDFRRQADLFDITNATDIHGTVFDNPSNPIANDGKLNKSITPATYAGFVSLIDKTQLARFGMHNGAYTVINTSSGFSHAYMAPCFPQATPLTKRSSTLSGSRSHSRLAWTHPSPTTTSSSLR